LFHVKLTVHRGGDDLAYRPAWADGGIMSETKPAPAILEEQHLLYLDALQESHVTSMYGAGPYLEAEFDLTRREAADVLVHWMRTFADRHPTDVPWIRWPADARTARL
jgi:hypothetical protein